MKKLLKILVSIMVCLVIVGCQKKDDVKLNVSVEKDVVNVGDVFGGNIDFEPKDKIDNYQFGLEYNDELLEFNRDDNTLKALKAGETDIQFYAVNKKSNEKFYSNKVNITIKDKITSISATYKGKTDDGTFIDNTSLISVVGVSENGTKVDLKGWKVENPGALKTDQTSTFKIKYNELSCDLKIKCTTLSKKKYKSQCHSIGYNELARNGNKHKGELMKFTGRIIQINDISGGKGAQMRIATKGNYENVILVGYIYKDNQSRFLEKDKVTVYGECNGLYTYTSTMGAHITVPSCNAEYIDMN